MVAFVGLIPALLPLASFAQTSYTWNGSANSAWNNAANWTPNSGFPLATDDATIVAAGNAPMLDMARNVTNLTVFGGTLDLNGFTLTSTGNGSFSGGAVNNGTFAANSAAGTMNFGATTFGASVSGTTDMLYFFNAPVDLTKTGSSNDYSNGGTTFNSTLTLTVTAGRVYPAYTGATVFNGNVVLNSTGASGGVWLGQNGGTMTLATGRTITAGTFNSGWLVIRNLTQVGATPQNITTTGTSTVLYQVGTTFNANVTSSSPGLYLNGATFNGTAHFTKTGSTNEYSGGNNTFNALTEFVVTGAGRLYLANTGADQYNADVLINCTSAGSGGIWTGNSGGTSVLAAGRTISVGATGYTGGLLYLANFTMTGTMPQVLNLGSAVTYAQLAGFNGGGNLTVTAGSILLNGGTVSGNATYAQIGNVDSWSQGNCVFNGDLELVNNSTSIFGPCDTGADAYNGNIRVSNTSTGQIRFGNSGGVGTLAAGRTLTVGNGGFNNGLFLLDNFVQAGATPQAWTLGANAIQYIRSGCSFSGALDITAGGFIVDGSTFNGNTRFTKTGTSTDTSPGGNVFQADLDLVNNLAGGLYFANNAADTYNGNVRVSNLSTGEMRFGNGGGGGTLASGRTIAVGTGGFNAGILLLRGINQLGTAPQSLSMGTSAILYFHPGTTFNGDVVATSGRMYFYGSTFNGAGTFTKTGVNTDNSQGGCVFQATTEFTNMSTGSLFLADNGYDTYNGDLRVNSLSTGQIRFGNSAGGATLANGRTITVGAGGFNTGVLLLRNFTQVGSTPQNLSLGTSATLYFYPGTTFNGDVVVSSGRLYFNGATFNGIGTFTKTGINTDQSPGGCVFQSTAEFTNANVGSMYLADNTFDAYNGDLRVNNLSTGQIRFGDNGGGGTLATGRTIAVGSGGFNTGLLMLRGFNQLGTTPQYLDLGSAASLYYYRGTVFNGPVTSNSGGLFFWRSTFNGSGDFIKTGTSSDASAGNNVFNGPVVFSNTSTGNLSLNYTGVDSLNGDVLLNNTVGGAINFGQSGGSAVLAAGRTIEVGGSGFNVGQLVLRNFTQVGATPQNLLLGNSAWLYIQSGCVFNGDLVTTSAGLYLNGSTFNGTARFTKTGSSGDGSTGGNLFNGFTELFNTGTGYLSLNYTGTDLFNADLQVSNTSTGRINFGQNGGSATLAAGRTITVGSSGFNTGTLYLRNFTQTGGTAQSIMLGNNATMYFSTGSTFNGNVTSSAGNMYLDGTVFNGTGWFRKTGAVNNSNQGGNVFNGNVELVCTGAGQWHLDNTGVDLFNADLQLNCTGTGGLYFGTGTGSATMASGTTLGIGSTGFAAGMLQFRNFTKLSSSASTLIGSVNTSVNFLPGSTFNGDLDVTAGNLNFNSTTFNGKGTFTKTAAGGNSSYGNNTFNDDVVFNNQGQISLAVNAADTYNGDATFRRLGAGTLFAHYNFDAHFRGNVSTVGSTASVQFGNGATARTIFDGTTVQTFSSDAAYPPSVRNLTLAMTGAGELQLLGDMSVTSDVAFTSGVIKPMAATSTGNGLLILNNGITFSDAADASSHADGFVRKIGNAAFSFPVGNAGILAPIAISAQGLVTNHFTAKYVYQDPHPTYHAGQLDPPLDHVSRCEYWILDRTGGASNVNVTLAYDSVRSCGVTNLSDLAVARWNGTIWKDHGNGGTVGTLASGTIVTAAPVSAFSPFTLASRSSMNPLPIELLYFDAVADDEVVRTSWSTASELNNDRFEVERSADGHSFVTIGTVDGAGNSMSTLNYTFIDDAPLPGLSYYRLTQVDHDGTSTSSEVVAVTRPGNAADLSIWPNPARDVLNVMAGNGPQVIGAQVHDASGRLVQDRGFPTASGTAQLDLNDVPSGVLFLSVRFADGTVQQQRFLKE